MCTTHTGAAGMLKHRNIKFTIENLKSSSLFPTNSHYQFLDVSQDMSQLYLLYPLSQV